MPLSGTQIATALVCPEPWLHEVPDQGLLLFEKI